MNDLTTGKLKLPLVYDARCGTDVETLVATACHIRYDAVFVDYLQLVNSPGSEEYLRVSHTSKVLSKLSGKQGGMGQNYQPLVVALSHFSRAAMKDQEEQERFPCARDFKSSSQIEQDADVGLVLHRRKRDPEGTVLLKVVKNRFGPKDRVIPLECNGPLGYVEESSLPGWDDPA